MRTEALKEIMAIALEEFEEPLDKVRGLIDPFVQTAEVFMETVKQIKEGWTTLVNGLVHVNISSVCNFIHIT